MLTTGKRFIDRFFTILHLIISPNCKESSFQLIESVERAVNLLLLVVLLTNGYQPHCEAIILKSDTHSYMFYNQKYQV